MAGTQPILKHISLAFHACTCHGHWLYLPDICAFAKHLDIFALVTLSMKYIFPNWKQRLHLILDA